MQKQSNLIWLYMYVNIFFSIIFVALCCSNHINLWWLWGRPEMSMNSTACLGIYGICFAIYFILMSFSGSPSPGLTQDWKYNPWFWSCRYLLMALILRTDTSVGLLTVWWTYVRLCRIEIQNTNFALVFFLIITVHYFQGQFQLPQLLGTAEQQVVFVLWSYSLWLHNPNTIQALNLQTMNILIFSYSLLLHDRMTRQNELSFACDHSSSTAGCCVLFFFFFPSTGVLSIH